LLKRHSANLCTSSASLASERDAHGQSIRFESKLLTKRNCSLTSEKLRLPRHLQQRLQNSTPPDSQIALEKFGANLTAAQ
jgi:hypothetical protein